MPYLLKLNYAENTEEEDFYSGTEELWVKCGMMLSSKCGISGAGDRNSHAGRIVSLTQQLVYKSQLLQQQSVQAKLVCH